MQSLLFYLLKTVLLSAILFGYYRWALHNKPFHVYNRFYLLLSVLVSLCIPLIKINFWQSPASQSSNIIHLLQAVAGNEQHTDIILPSSGSSVWNIEHLLIMVYICLCLILFFSFIHSLFTILRLVKTHTIEKKDGISLVYTNAKNTPFSFLHFVFWNNAIDISSATGQQILSHEITHIRGRHSYDKLFLNMVLIFCWYNPFFWLIKKELGMLHEFIADKNSVPDNDTSAFATMILQTAYPQQQFHLTNHFFQSPIKRRLTMITNNNNKAGYFSRMLVLPLLLLVSAAFTFKSVTQKPFYTGQKIIVVIDAGHGGKDFGAAGAGNVYEKSINLALAKKVKELNKNENIDIILTRETDIYQTPQEKTNIVNMKKAGLFISFHADAATSDSAEIKSGINMLVPNDELPNAMQSKVLASAMIEIFKGNYPLPVTPNPVQRQQGIWILKNTKCPSILMEAGFITNRNDLVFLQSEKGQEMIAQNILNGIEKYLNAAPSYKKTDQYN